MVANATVPGILRTGTHASRPAATDVAVGTIYSCTTHGLVYQSDGSAWATWASASGIVIPVIMIIDGAGTTITTGIKGDLPIPFAWTDISAARALADQSGSIQVDVWKDTYANFPPVDADSITASAPIVISSATKSENTTLTGWTKTGTAGDILRFNVDSVSTIQRCTIELDLVRA